MNEKLSRIVELLEAQAPRTESPTVDVSPEPQTFTEKYKRKQAEDDAIAQLAKTQRKELKAKEVSLWK